MLRGIFKLKSHVSLDDIFNERADLPKTRPMYITAPTPKYDYDSILLTAYMNCPT
jgi:hypothetical protein